MAITPALFAVACLAFAAPSVRAAASEQEVTFAGAGGVKLSGTLTLPSGADERGKVPGVVLVQGSGPTDRNGNQPPLLWTGLLKQLAEALAERGIASLRYDKRGQYRSGPRPKDLGALAEFAAWDHFVADVVAAHEAMAGRPEVDGDRIALVGHSEGGLLVMHAAVALGSEGNARPAAVVLLATPGRPLDVVLREQLKASFQRLGMAPAAVERLLAENDAVLDHIREHATVPANVPPDFRPLYPPYIRPFLNALMGTPPAALAGRVAGPVLIIQGEKDLQVSAERDAPVLAEALRIRPGAPRTDAVTVGGASHNLKRVAKDGEHALFGPVVPEAREALVEWLAEILDAPTRSGAQ